jgi:isocitrate dehydrogenase (NAD+)
MFKVVLIKGDGIGPEISDAIVEIFHAAKVPIKWVEHQAGLNVIEKHPTGIPTETLENMK